MVCRLPQEEESKLLQLPPFHLMMLSEEMDLVIGVKHVSSGSIKLLI